MGTLNSFFMGVFGYMAYAKFRNGELFDGSLYLLATLLLLVNAIAWGA